MSTRRSKDEIIAEMDAKIAYHDGCIAKLKERKEALLKPPVQRVRKTSMRKALDALRESGMSPDEIIATIEKAMKAKQRQESKGDA